MTHIPAAQATIELDKLLDKVAQGEDVVIVRPDGSAFKLVALSRAPRPIFGSARGQVQLGPDFDEPLEGMEDYMP
jgi:antitoxin (DNA-binding transcriptional repressor) of toxin-antitoxin stability system